MEIVRGRCETRRGLRSKSERRCYEEVEQESRIEHLVCRDKISSYSNEQVCHLFLTCEGSRGVIQEIRIRDGHADNPLQFPLPAKFALSCRFVATQHRRFL